MRDILLMENNEELAGLLATFLTKANYSVTHAADGETARMVLAKGFKRNL